MQIQCGYPGCGAVIAAADLHRLTDAQWHHLVGVHHPDLYARLGFDPAMAQHAVDALHPSREGGAGNDAR